MEPQIKVFDFNDLSGVAGGPGFEPGLTESESAVLPLNYPPPWRRERRFRGLPRRHEVSGRGGSGSGALYRRSCRLGLPPCVQFPPSPLRPAGKRAPRLGRPPRQAGMTRARHAALSPNFPACSPHGGAPIRRQPGRRRRHRKSRRSRSLLATRGRAGAAVPG